MISECIHAAAIVEWVKLNSIGDILNELIRLQEVDKLSDHSLRLRSKRILTNTQLHAVTNLMVASGKKLTAYEQQCTRLLLKQLL